MQSALAERGDCLDVAVIGGGLAGGLLALALADAGQEVALVDGGPAGATGLSYGVVVGKAVAAWHQLQRRHGDLGLRSCQPIRQQACARVDGLLFPTLLARALAAAGVLLPPGPVEAPLTAPGPGFPWCLGRSRGAQPPWPQPLLARQVVLAAGAYGRALWPALPERLRTSWAGVIRLERPPQIPSWPDRGRAPLLIPQHFSRLDLEARAAELSQPEWVVDPGLAPWGDGALLGQISWISPGLPPGTGLPQPPDPVLMEGHLRSGLAGMDPALAQLAGRFQQVPVAFCIGSTPLVGPVAAAAGLWAFTGFSGAFSQVPLLTGQLAGQISNPG